MECGCELKGSLSTQHLECRTSVCDSVQDLGVLTAGCCKCSTASAVHAGCHQVALFVLQVSMHCFVLCCHALPSSAWLVCPWPSRDNLLVHTRAHALEGDCAGCMAMPDSDSDYQTLIHGMCWVKGAGINQAVWALRMVMAPLVDA